MQLSDISVKRPVLALVASLFLIAFGAIAFRTLPLRELPDVDAPVVSISTQYRGASSEIIESRITQVIEDQLSGIEGIDSITSTSRDGRSSINVEFKLGRDIEAAANDVRNAVGRVQDQLPQGVDPPTVQKTDADAEAIIWLNMSSTTINRVDLTDYAERYVVDRLSTLPGVANVRIGGSLRPAMRIWIDPEALAARGLTVDDVDQALRAQNIELPGGYVEGPTKDYTVRINREYRSEDDFRRLPVGRAAQGGYQVRLGDVARVERAPEDLRRLFRGNGVNQIGLGIARQSKSNALEVGQAVKAEVEKIRPTLPAGTQIFVASDSTVFIQQAIDEVWKTMGEAILLVVVVIFLFLGSLRAAFIPSAVIPVCLVGVFLVLGLAGFSINLLTLLALVLAIGLVVDDSIVVLENVQRRVDMGEPAAVAALRGTRQVAFAVIATSAVLITVFAPLLFVGGYVGRLFIELAVTMAGVVAISAFCSLTLTPMMCSKIVRPIDPHKGLPGFLTRRLDDLRAAYRTSLEAVLAAKWLVGVIFALVVVAGLFMLSRLPSELLPKEDRGNFMLNIQGPEGAGFDVTEQTMMEVEKILLGYVENGEASRILIVVPRFQDSGVNRFNAGNARVFLADWKDRERSGFEILDELNQKLGQIPNANARAMMQSPISGGSGGGDEVSIVIAGEDYAQIAAIADRVVEKARSNPGLVRPRSNYEPSNPRVIVDIDRERAAALGVSTQAIGRTLEATMGSRRVNTYIEGGEEYYVIIQAERAKRQSMADMAGVYVRSDRSGELVPLANLVSFRTVGDSAELRRVNRLRSVSVGAGLASGYTIGEGLAFLESAARQEMSGTTARVDYTGAAKQFRDASGAIMFAFAIALLVVFLTLAAQFESFIHPFTIMFTVPLALAGGAFGLFMLNGSLNIYSQIGMIILIALAAKNGILLVEFANQLRDEGRAVRDAILESAELRLRPILMTSVATVAGAMPLIFGDGAGAESRRAIGVVIVFGVGFATFLTLFVVPVVYDLLARFTKSPEATARAIEAYEEAEKRAQPAE
jgi:multidrug efflux pump